MTRIEEAFAERAVRRDGGRELPLGPRATRTRESILAAATTLFADGGYGGTTMADVAAAAGTSLGAVYQYFRDRTDLVAAVVQRQVASMLGEGDLRWRADEGLAGVERVIGAFVRSYAAAPGLAGVWEEVVFIDPSLADLRRSLSRLFEGTVAAELRRAAAAGLVRDDMDPALAARALAGMVDRWCYLTYVFDPPEGGPPPPEEGAALLARLWAAGIGLRERD